MTKEIMQSFRELLSQTNWIDEETKDMAAQKVNAMTLRIGYPDFILNSQLLNERYKDVSNCIYKSEISKLRMHS
jgi:predicted metalloendopeptidase